MPANRPPIPTEVQREVLIEAGHRCAGLGEANASWNLGLALKSQGELAILPRFAGEDAPLA